MFDLRKRWDHWGWVNRIAAVIATVLGGFILFIVGLLTFVDTPEFDAERTATAAAALTVPTTPIADKPTDTALTEQPATEPPTDTPAPTTPPTEPPPTTAIPATEPPPPTTAIPATEPPPPTAPPPPSGPVPDLSDAPPPGEPWHPCAQGQIKANTNSGIYHPPGGAFYRRTFRSVWCFNTAAEAEAAGYRRAER